MLPEGVVEGEESRPVLGELDDRNLLGDFVPGDYRVVDHQAGHVVVGLVIGVEEGGGDVGAVEAGIGFAGDVHLVALHGKGINEVLPETHELSGDILLASGGDVAGREAGADGLLDPDDVGQGVPAPRVLDGLVSTILPEERSVLLEETFQ